MKLTYRFILQETDPTVEVGSTADLDGNVGGIGSQLHFFKMWSPFMIMMVMFVEIRMSVEDVTKHRGFRLLVDGDRRRHNSSHRLRGLRRRR